ncbi:MAG: hypothetical protein HGA85_03445 [Nanoarchaeota archaeon]|nr:hypothetical protein [Nanoarchaeota archaeon]
MKNRQAEILLLIFSILFALIVADFIIRHYLAKFSLDSFNKAGEPRLLIHNPRFRPEGNADVVFIGDSFTYGFRLKDRNESYPSQVSKISGMSTANYASPGQNQLDIFWVFNNKIAHQPKIIIYGFYWNDLEYTKGNPAGDNIDSRYCREITQDDSWYIHKIIIEKIKQAIEPGDSIDYFLRHDTLALKCQQSIFRRMRDSSNSTIIILNIPMNSEEDPRDQMIEQRIYAIAKEEGLLTIDGANTNFKQRANYTYLKINETDIHYNGIGNRILAEIVSEYIETIS